MENPDAAGRQSLPPINHFNMDRIKREEIEAQRIKAVSPMAPPPQHGAYSGSQTYTPKPSGLASLSGILSPSEPPRPNAEDKEQRLSTTRLSLPSIHEALNGEQPLPQPPTSNPPHSSTPFHSQHAPTNPPPEHAAHPFAPELINKGPAYPAQSSFTPISTASNGGPAIAAAPDPNTRGSFPSHASSNGKLPALHPLKTMESPISTSRPINANPFSQQGSPQHETGSRSAGNTPYGYAPANPVSGYPYSAPPQNTSANPYSAPPPYAQPRYPNSWRPDEVNRVEESKRNGRSVGAPYGESVKRHLDNFDLEASLNEIADGSGKILDFTRDYTRPAHQSARQGLGLTLSAMPTTEAIEDLMKQTQRIQESLVRMRDVVVTQQVAMAEQGQEARFKAGNGYGQYDESSGFADDQKGAGAFGPDAKKRRGRAAPPGRCHSCNRAETPEWRRGPDGARTLCNACGLHYAKLTRKMGTNKAQVGSSNLRPKSLADSPPPA